MYIVLLYIFSKVASTGWTVLSIQPGVPPMTSKPLMPSEYRVELAFNRQRLEVGCCSNTHMNTIVI